jgi:hypothetical protein
MLVRSKRMRWARYDERKEKCVHFFWWGNLKVQDHFENLGTDRRIILK